MSLIIKFLTRRVKTRVKKVQKNLKSLNAANPDSANISLQDNPTAKKSPNDLDDMAARKIWGQIGYMG